MSKAQPNVFRYMTTQPYSIDYNATIEEAQELMNKYQIRHLPVMKNDQLHGILSDRDIKTAGSFIGKDTRKMQVHLISHEQVYEVSPESHLIDVVEEMARRHYGCAVVMQNRKLVGIFTAMDACKALADVLKKMYDL